MHKRIILLGFTFVIFFFTVSCGIDSVTDIDFDTYGKIGYTKEGEDYILTYQNKKYYPAEKYLFDVIPNYDEDVELGWYFNFPFSGAAYYHSYTAESPAYMYCSVGANDVYIREDYDYKSDVFVLEGTETGIVFSDAFGEGRIKHSHSSNYNDSIKIVWHSREYPNLRISAYVYSIEDKWYMNTVTLEDWELSNEFVNVLIENEIIANYTIYKTMFCIILVADPSS